MKDAITSISITLGTLLALILLFEVYLWLRYEREYERLEARYEGRELCSRSAREPILVYEFIPDKCGHNSLGFADVEHEVVKPMDTYRILLVGDSVAAGNGVGREDRFSTILASRLNAIQEQLNFEIVILARGGYSTEQQLFLLTEMGFAYHPDLIIWSYVLNDPAHPIFHDANGEFGKYYFRPAWRGLHYVEQKLFEARENSLRDECGTEFHQLLHCAYRKDVAADISLLGELSRENTTPVVFIIHPVFEENRNLDNYSARSIHEDLGEMASAAGMQVVDLIEAFRGVTTDRLVQKHHPWFDPWHPNELGHLLIANYLFDELQRLELDGLE